MISLLFLAVVIGVVVWLVAGSRRHGAAPDRGVHTLRRFVQYTFLLAALFTAGTGASRLVITALPGETIAERRVTEVALGVALTIVAVPVWLLLWRQVSRHLVVDAEERASTGWALYLVIATTVSLVVAFVQLLEIGRWAIGAQPYAPEPIAFAAVFLVLWVAHTWLLMHPQWRPTGRPAPLAMLAGSVVGLVGVAVGGGGVLAAGLRALYELIAGPLLVAAPLDVTLGTSVILAVLGAMTWWWHWWRQGLTAERTGLWHAYVLLIGVLGGLLTAVSAAGTALHSVVQWWVGEPWTTTAAAHFDVLPTAIAAGFVGAWVWWYHRRVLDARPSPVRTEPERVYGYLVSAVGLVAAAAGVTVAIMAAIQALTPGALAVFDARGRNTLAAAITLLVVGLPLWVTFWHRLQLEVARNGPAERRSVTRRSYLMLLFGAAGLTAAVSVGVVLYVVIRDLLEQQLAVTVLHDLRAAIGLIITAGAIATYHVFVYRADRLAVPAEEVRHPRDVLLVSSDGRDLASAVAAGTGARVHGLHRLDVAPHAIDVDRVTAAILASPHERVLVTIDEQDRVVVIPYDRG